MKEIKKMYIKIIVSFIFMMGALLYLIPMTTNAIHSFNGNVQKDSKEWECVMSSYNKYSNSTEASYFFGKCYVPIYHTYETNEKCGLFGISCYETNNPHTEVIKDEICFRLKTGELC